MKNSRHQIVDAGGPALDPLNAPNDTPGLAAQLITAAQAHLRRFDHVSSTDPQVPPCTASGAREHVLFALEELERALACSVSGATIPNPARRART